MEKQIRKNLFVLVTLIFLFMLFNCDRSKNPAANTPEGITENLDPFQQNQLLRRSLNLGNALEAPKEGDWGVTLKAEYFQLIKAAGFDGVRLPIRWSTHAAADSPYTIEAAFFSRIDWAVNQAILNELAVVINIHHYEEIMVAPEQHRQRLLGMWRQISAHYRTAPKTLFFELLNEPNNKLTPALWNSYLAEVITVVREANPKRTLIVGTANWGGLSALNELVLPAADQNLIVTYHFYDPFHFTHQGAEWVDGSESWLGTTWWATTEEKEAITNEFDRVVAWAENQQRPLLMGEFGAYQKAALDSRYRWTSFVAREAEKRNISWAYWEFCSGFGVYDRSTRQWNSILLSALIP